MDLIAYCTMDDNVGKGKQVNNLTCYSNAFNYWFNSKPLDLLQFTSAKQKIDKKCGQTITTSPKRGVKRKLEGHSTSPSPITYDINKLLLDQHIPKRTYVSEIEQEASFEIEPRPLFIHKV